MLGSAGDLRVIVVHGTVRATLEAHIHAGDTSKVLEGSEIATATHRRDMSVPNVSDCLTFGGLIGGLNFIH